jgi:Na+-translocating ferredoxin:NAD+ oxidoreductase RnfD subunit
MGYFDGLAASSFKKDDKGNTLFFPWGILGKGYLLPEDRKDDIRRSLKRHMMLVVPLAIACSMFTWIGLLVALPLYYVSYAFWVNRLIKGLPTSTEKLTFADSTTGAAQAHNTITLWLLEIGSLLFVLAGIYVLIVKPEKWIIGLSSILFFGFCALVCWRMIEAKSDQDS